jgi:hypothetical protein
LVRRAFGLEWEIQVLLAAENGGATFYTLLGERTADPALQQVCRLIMRDEARHLEFHRDYFCGRHTRRPAWRRRLWIAQFALVAATIAQVAWLDHRGCLNAYGVERGLFLALVRALTRHVAGGVHPRVRQVAVGERARPVG